MVLTSVVLIVWKGLRNINLTTAKILITIFATAGGGALLYACFVMPYLWVRVIRQD